MITIEQIEEIKKNIAFLKEHLRQSLHEVMSIDEIDLRNIEEITFDNPKDTLNKAGAKVTTQCSAVIMGCFVAKGAYEAMLFGQGKPEDIAALAVIVPEAGGKVTDLFGNDQRYDTNTRGAIVSNGALHDKLVEVIKGINYTSKYLAK